MDIKLIKESGTNIRLQIENEDFSISDIIHHELLKDPKVVIAGVLTPHPLLKQHVIKMEVKAGINPLSILKTSGEQAVKTSEDMLEEAQRAFKEGNK